ncbi:endonuclease V [Psychrobacter sp. I-STPA10]|uniref:endonuclease V n=1 Tax=Psychrobacter sp. I-STPA10 TaxID=2585769 RepID=UPI001E45BB94|nr:endonuclease V [Psychrobacter sp. I-STPA10]
MINLTNQLTYLILDVHYQEENGKIIAHVAGVRFQGIEQNQILAEYQTTVSDVAPYESGQFYKREMPCLLALIEQVSQPYDVIIIDGYVWLDGVQKAGLGKYLYDHLNDKKPIIGIAKNQFCDISDEYAVWRGRSKHPLYVTSIGIDTLQAKDMVSKLAGEHRIPTIVTHVDRLGRK